MSNFVRDMFSEAKKGNYGAVGLMALSMGFGIAIPVLWYAFIGKADQVVEGKDASAKELKEQKIADQRRCDSISAAKDEQFALISKEFNEFKDNYIKKLEGAQSKSEELVKQSKRALRTIDRETRKSKENSKELDSVSRSINI